MGRTWLTYVSVFALLACGEQALLEGEVVSTVSDPENVVTVSVTREGHGATVPWVYRVYVQPTTGDGAHELLRADKAQDLTAAWLKPDTLRISMKCGRIFMFQNFFDVMTVDGALKKRITVQLDNGGLCAA